MQQMTSVRQQAELCYHQNAHA